MYHLHYAVHIPQELYRGADSTAKDEVCGGVLRKAGKPPETAAADAEAMTAVCRQFRK